MLKYSGFLYRDSVHLTQAEVSFSAEKNLLPTKVQKELQFTSQGQCRNHFLLLEVFAICFAC